MCPACFLRGKRGLPLGTFTDQSLPLLARTKGKPTLLYGRKSDTVPVETFGRVRGVTLRIVRCKRELESIKRQLKTKLNPVGQNEWKITLYSVGVIIPFALQLGSGRA